MTLRQFSNLPITRKLILMMLLTSVTAVLVVSGVFGATEALTYRSNMVDEVTTLGDVIGTNSTAAVTFEDEGLAKQVLASLSADSSIASANIFLANGGRLASYSSEADGPVYEAIDADTITSLLETVTLTGRPVEQFVGLHLIDTVRPVVFDNELIGMLHLRASLHDLVMTLRRIGIMAIGTVLFAILIAYLLSFRLQAFISRPILRLADLMKRVSENQDYSLRAKLSGSDEIGTLMSGFNSMLAQLSIRDVELAKANQQLQLSVEETLKAKEAAESASSAKSDFLARMSHEIRTPMNGVLGMTELLLSADLKRSERKFAETIKQSGEALLALINDILDFSKIEAGKLDIEESAFELREVIEGVVDLLYSRAHSNGVELIGAIGPNVCTTVRGDPIRLRQVLLNLVGNAVKFTHQGEVVVELSQEKASAGQAVFRFSVRDTGIGIEAQQVRSIFERFTQADVSTTREYGGTGLGLAISRQLVELMGGEIGVDSISGKGSTFWFTLPLQCTDASELNEVHEFEPMPGVCALVVDDNETNREVLRQQLAAWEIDVRVASDAQAALEVMQSSAAEEHRFDLVLLDFLMPKKDGLTLAADIREGADLGEPRLLMLSSVGSEYDETAMREAGIDVYLTKPVRQSVLYEAIVSAFDADRRAARHIRYRSTGTVATDPRMNLTVLLAEDIPTNMQVARHMLMSLGCAVVQAENGRQALEAIDRNDIDLVLMDCQMPVMDGYTATRQQRNREEREDRRRLPIIALTANALPEDRQKCLESGMDDFISKPFTRQVLAATMSNWCDAKEVATVRDGATTSGKVIAADGSKLDLDALQQIAELDPENDGTLLRSVIETYVDTAGTLLQQLRESIQQDNLDGIIQASHALKSSSANVGAVRLSELASLIEHSARDSKPNVAVDNIEQVESEFETAIVQLLAIKQEAAA